jgi:hypothetical protein
VTQAVSDPLADPASNTEPSQAFWNACYGMSTSKADNDACDAAALVDFNSVRASEGLPSMTLPSGFDTLSVPLQMLAISNVERVDRGLAPVAGLSSNLDVLAQDGADNDQDPTWPSPFPGTAGTSNWAGAGNSALLDDFLFMYDDGYGSPNIDCSTPTDSGCWGHRHNVIAGFDDPIVMGAAVAYNTPYGTSITEEFIGGDTTDRVDVAPNWADISGTSWWRLNTQRLIIVTDTGRSATGSVVASGSGGPQHLTATAGGTGWSVSPSTCDLPSGGQCSFTVRFNPPSSGTSTGWLKLSGPTGTKQVTLTGWQPPPRLSAATSTHRVRRDHRARITGVLASYQHVALAHRRVMLQRRHRAGGHWHEVITRRSRANGVVHFVVRPHRVASYRLVAIARNGKLESTSRAMRIRVKR